MKFLVTGCAGFIGSFLTERLLQEGHEVLGIDNLNHYYDPALKRARLDRLKNLPGFSFFKADVGDSAELEKCFTQGKPEFVVHLAAQVGVRYSLENPRAYVDSNVVGFLNILESCRKHSIQDLFYASSSSVYGNATKLPLEVSDRTDQPISLYAATKKSNELMAYTYSHLFGLRTVGLRFFTVYGPWGRPDMAVFKFTRSILDGKPIEIFNEGKHTRDMTYVGDTVESLIRLIHLQNEKGPSLPANRIYNVGNEKPVQLMRLIEVIEEKTGKKALKNFTQASPGDVDNTLADSSELYRDTGFKPKTTVEEGVAHFVEWYRSYRGEK